jgi:hypothetical protein
VASPAHERPATSSFPGQDDGQVPEAFEVQAARHRRGSFWLIRLHLLPVLQHERAWMAQDKACAARLVDELLGRSNLAKTG